MRLNLEFSRTIDGENPRTALVLQLFCDLVESLSFV